MMNLVKHSENYVETCFIHEKARDPSNAGRNVVTNSPADVSKLLGQRHVFLPALDVSHVMS